MGAMRAYVLLKSKVSTEKIRGRCAEVACLCIPGKSRAVQEGMARQDTVSRVICLSPVRYYVVVGDCPVRAASDDCKAESRAT